MLYGRAQVNPLGLKHASFCLVKMSQFDQIDELAMKSYSIKSYKIGCKPYVFLCIFIRNLNCRLLS